MEETVRVVRDHMEQSIDALKRGLGQVRTGRASLSILDGIRVEYYGTLTPLHQLATLSVPEPRLITIQPWDASVADAIEKAILTSDLGLTPNNDGKMIRIPIPPLTEERRKELVKVVRKMGEECRVAVRNIRREGIEKLRKREKAENLPQDDVRQIQEQIQKVTDGEIQKIDQLIQSKEREILEV